MYILYTLYVLIFISLLFLLSIHLETRRLRVEILDHSLGSSYIKILFFTDIHIKMMFVNPLKIANILTKHEPDIVIFSGDYMDSSHQLYKFVNFLESLNIKCPTIMCYGNHDHKLFLKKPEMRSVFESEMERLGVNLLVNSSYIYTKNSQTYKFISIDEIKKGKPDVEAAISSCHQIPGLKFGITHNPDLVLDLNSEQFDYLVGGHFHGGQIWMPFHFEFIVLRKDLLCKKHKIYKGFHKINGIAVYISRGLGCVLFPFRFRSKPEITLIKLPNE